MKLRIVGCRNHLIFGNLDIDLTNQDGGSFGVIILAGANGCGKTLLLEAIYALIVGNDPKIKTGSFFGRFEIEQYEAERLQQIRNIEWTGSTLTLSYDCVSDNHFTYSGSVVTAANDTYALDADEMTPLRNALRCFMSEANVIFTPSPTNFVTSLDLDRPSARSARSGPDIAREITQLLIDIDAADSDDLKRWVWENPGMAPPFNVQEPRISRFKKAFSYIFEGKNLHHVSRSEGAKTILFKENGRTSTIDELSTGEKQIVFRASFLLRDRNALQGSIILIDEPELSLHPQWQDKIVDFYKKALEFDDGNHPQIILATHSPFIVNTSIGSKTIILEKNNINGSTQVMNPSIFPDVTGWHIIQTFDLDSFLNRSKRPVILMTEGESDCEILTIAWNKIFGGKSAPFDCQAMYGDRNICIALNNKIGSSKLSKRKILAIFDFDQAYDQWKGVWKSQPHIEVENMPSRGLTKKHGEFDAWAMLLPVPSYREKIASPEIKSKSLMSIEFLFEDRFIPNEFIYYEKAPQDARYPRIMDRKKMDFVKHVATLEVGAFAAFGPIFDRVKEILNHSA